VDGPVVYAPSVDFVTDCNVDATAEHGGCCDGRHVDVDQKRLTLTSI